MSDVYALPCLTCGHLIDDHDANECWNYDTGGQCDCPWMRWEGDADWVAAWVAEHERGDDGE